LLIDRKEITLTLVYKKNGFVFAGFAAGFDRITGGIPAPGSIRWRNYFHIP
jgi:hypothetical protein